MTFNKEALKQLAKEQVEKIMEESEGLNCFGRFFTWEELKEAMISFVENKLSAELYPVDLDDWDLADLPFERTLENRKKLWDKLSSHTQAIAAEFGCRDTEFRDSSFNEIVKEVFHFASAEEYYRSCTFADYFQKHICIPVD